VISNSSSLPENWTIKEIRSFCETSSGGTPSRTHPEYFKGDIPWVKIGDMSNWIVTETEERISKEGLDNSSAKIFPKGTVLISIFASIGTVAILGIEATTNQAIAGIIPDPKVVNNKYLAYYLLSIRPQLEAMSRGVAQKNINQKILRSIRVVVPPLDVQLDIVKILDGTRALQQKREQANQLANELLLAVFMQMFGKKKPNNVVGDIAEFVSSGSTPLGGQKTYLSSGIMFIRSQNVHMNEFKLDDVAYISEETHEKMKRTWLKNDDVLLNITGASLGRVAVYKGDDNKANVNQHVCIIRLNKSKALSEYVSYYLSLPSAQREIWTSQAGASRQALNFQQVKELKLLLPAIEEQRSFVNFMNIVKKIKENQQRSSREIKSLFSSLLAEALSGSIL
jgi:type I restriction enzyme S subunit